MENNLYKKEQSCAEWWQKKTCSVGKVNVQKEKHSRFWVKGIHLPICQKREPLSYNITAAGLLHQNTVYSIPEFISLNHALLVYMNSMSFLLAKVYNFLPIVGKIRDIKQKAICAHIELMEQCIWACIQDSIKPHSHGWKTGIYAEGSTY